ncbi:MAG: 2-oxoacid:acceptor oxidoreductase subunit alpha [Candidatus Sumerlaeaceae bacterium]|nr:2-oxoacid:acceptor oxidoreductase subunit alpha [Candidatus Sumerlaeaceae bacterium]
MKHQDFAQGAQDPAALSEYGPLRKSEGLRINDVVISVATSNGTGSISANLVLTRAIFQMGIPVGAKNLFPSNIQGLPTWFTIRANEHGWLGRRADVDLLVAMNRESVAADLAALPSGAVVVLHADLSDALQRDDLVVYHVPFSQLVEKVCAEPKLRRLVVNMVYVGVTGWLLGIEMQEILHAITRQFTGRPKAIEINQAAAKLGFEWAGEKLTRQERFRLERRDLTQGKILIEGNVASAIGLMYGGLQVFAWYPITPSSSLAEALSDLMSQWRRDAETGKATYAILQAEDELAAIGVVVGAGWAGARAATATSGPGLSLMAEIVGLAYFAEIPAVIIDVQRVGPSTGLPTRTSQGDMLKAYYLSHGDCKHVLLIPANPREAFEFSYQALDLAQRLQAPVFVMSDLDLGMNYWMSDSFQPPSKPLDRGKVLSAAQLEQITDFARYRDVDGDGIPYRTLPGTRHPKAPFFTQGAGHDDRARRSEKPQDWAGNLERLALKHSTARSLVPEPIVQFAPLPTRRAVIAYGSSDLPTQEALHHLLTLHECPLNYLRLRALPASEKAIEFIENHERVYIVEQNRDGQVACILRAEFPHVADRLYSILHFNGLPLDAETIVKQVLELEEREATAHDIRAAETLG